MGHASSHKTKMAITKKSLSNKEATKVSVYVRKTQTQEGLVNRTKAIGIAVNAIQI
jgi:hypothetical protein